MSMPDWECVLFRLVNYIENERYQGYDPYDILNSNFRVFQSNRQLRYIAIQLNKRIPISLRDLLNVEKGINPKGIGLILSSYVSMWKVTRNQCYLDKANDLFAWLVNNRNKNFSGYSWGYNFPWASREKDLAKFHPSIVVSGFIGKSIYDLYLATRDERCLELLYGINEYIDTHLHITRDVSGICFSYTDVVQDCCYNASLLGGEIKAILYKLDGNRIWYDQAKAVLDFVLVRQKADGRWNYAIDILTGKEDPQLDFHQGFVIDSFSRITEYLNLKDELYYDCIKRGLNFYYKVLYLGDGRFLWRYPKIFPVDIHNQAQGIITFSNHLTQYPIYREVVEATIKWTIQNLYDQDGGFFYYKFGRFVKHRTPYMRWSQAWMLKALSNYLEVSRTLK